MADRIGDQRAFAQEKEGAGNPRRRAQQRRANGHQSGIIAQLQQQRLRQHLSLPLARSAPLPDGRHRRRSASRA